MGSVMGRNYGKGVVGFWDWSIYLSGTDGSRPWEACTLLIQTGINIFVTFTSTVKVQNVHKSLVLFVQAVNLWKATLKTTNFPATPIM